MESQNCVFFVKSLEDGNTAKLYHYSEKICDSTEVKEEDRVHEECKRT